jgi:hypothetical protein
VEAGDHHDPMRLNLEKYSVGKSAELPHDDGSGGRPGIAMDVP